MKKASFVIILMSLSFVSYSQNYFQTTSSSSNSSKNITHFGAMTIGKQHVDFVPNPWSSYEDGLFRVDNQDKNVKFVVKNNYGTFNIAIASSNGAYFPSAQAGDVILNKQKGKNIFFSLNNTNNDGNQAFVFADNLNLSTLRIQNNGRVGIGNSNPQETLHINGNVRGNIGTGALRIRSSSGYIDVGAQNKAWAHFKTDRGKFWFNKDIVSGTDRFSSYSGDLIFQTAGSEKVRIKRSNGYLGVGTTSPSSLLDVYNSNGTRTKINSNDQSAISFWPNNGNSIFHISHGLNNDIHISHGVNPGDAKIMTIKNSGFVGIGTTVPDEKLTVKGKIHTQEIIVDLQGAIAPDYVFEKDYDLKSLEEIESYIIENKHLPEIPSAKKMKEEGIYLKKMNLLLLKKIEELTLYTLDQEKRLKVLESKLRNSDN